MVADQLYDQQRLQLILFRQFLPVHVLPAHANQRDTLYSILHLACALGPNDEFPMPRGPADRYRTYICIVD